MPGLSSDDQFQKVLAVAHKQLKSNKIQVRFGPLGKMRFIIDGVSLKDALAGSGVDEDTFREVFHGEIGPLLEAIVRNRLDDYIQNTAQYLLQVAGGEQQPAVQQATLRERAALIEKTLVTPDLQARYLIKVSSKHPRLRSYTWEVAKKFEASATVPRLHYATLSIETIRPEARLGIWDSLPFFPIESAGSIEHCAFDCDEADLDDLIQSLQEAKAALNRARKENGNG